jgi:Lactate dehydrogenase and related dehydrogenases
VAVCVVLVPPLPGLFVWGSLENSGTRLKLLATFGPGVDPLDFAVAPAPNFSVPISPAVLPAGPAAMSMALLVAVPRRLIGGAPFFR